MPTEKEWRTYFTPRRTLYALGLRNGMSFADLGCGYGTFSIAAAKIVGKKGKVYAIDIDPMMLRTVRQRARSERLENLTTILRDVFTTRRTKGGPSYVDFLLLANVIHGAKNKILLFSSVSSMLRPKGLIAVLNWKVEDTPRGPPMKMRPTEEQTVSYLKRAGYVDVSVVDVPPYHFAVIGHCANS